MKLRAINQRPLRYAVDENYEEVLTPYHMIFARNIDDNCTTDFYEMTSDNVRANLSMQRKLLSVFKKRFEAEYITTLQEKYINILYINIKYSASKRFLNTDNIFLCIEKFAQTLSLVIS